MYSPFLGKPNETLLVLKDLQPSRADKASRPRLGISLKNRTVGKPLLARKKHNWAHDVVNINKTLARRATDPAQPRCYPDLSLKLV